MNRICQKKIPFYKNAAKSLLGPFAAGLLSVWETPFPRRAPYRAGFTLIELLVVVLIIGILAAVAYPQYTKAVERSRAAKLYPLLNSLKESQERYFMANGTYATAFEELDISFNWLSNTKKHLFDGVNTVSLFNGDDMSVYIAYPPYRSCVFVMVAKGKFYKGYSRGNGLGYCFDRGQWFPNQEIFCQEDSSFEEGEFCRQIMGFDNFYGHVWHRYFTK